MEKIVFIVSNKSAMDLKVGDFLAKQGLRPVFTTEPDEIDQAGRQTGKAILIFTDIDFARNFLSEHHWIGFDQLRLLLVTKPVQNLKELHSLNLSPHLTAHMKPFLDEITNFMNNVAKSDQELIDELQFSASIKLGAKK